MDDDDFGDFTASPAPEEPASFAAFDAFPPDNAPSASVTEASPPRTQENEAASDEPAARTIFEAERDDDDFGDYREMPAPLSIPSPPPAPAPVPASPPPPADDDFGDFDEATPAPEKTPRPPVRAPSPVVERVSPGAFGDDLVAERSPEAFLEAVDAVLARAFPDAGTFGSAGTNGDGDGDGDGGAHRARVALARRARDAAGSGGLFADALDSCVAGWAPAVAAGVAPPDAARRAALAPKAWDASPARAALAAALRGAAAAPPPVPAAEPKPPDAPAPAPPAVAEKLVEKLVPEASLARAAEVADERVAEAPADPKSGGGAFWAFGEAEPEPEPEPFDQTAESFAAFGDAPAAIPAAGGATSEERVPERKRVGGPSLVVPSLADEEAAGRPESLFPAASPRGAGPETGPDPEDAFGRFEAAPPSPPPLRPAPVPSDPFRTREDGEGADAFGDFERPSADPPGFGAFEEAAPAPGAPPDPEAPEPVLPSDPSEPPLTDAAPMNTSPDPVPPEPAAPPTVSAVDDFADLFGPATDAGAVALGDDSRRENASEAPTANVAPLVPSNAPPDDFVDLFGPVQDTKHLELGAFEASPALATPPPPALEMTPPAAEAAEDAFGDFETSPMPSDVGDVDDGLGGFGDFAAAAAPVDALADLFGDAQVAGTPPPVADEDDFGAFQ